jgi:ATP-binding cassette subfamily C protein LapB
LTSKALKAAVSSAPEQDSGGQSSLGDEKLAVVDPQGKAAPSEIKGSDGADNLLECLLNVARHHNQPISAGAAISGLPLEDGYLTPGTLHRAALRAGLAANVFNKRLDSIPDFLFPCILLLDDRSACVVHKRVGDNFEIFNADAGPDTFSISAKDLAENYTGSAISLKPVPVLDIEERTRTRPHRGHWFWGVIKGLIPDYSQVILASFLVNSLAIAAPLFMLNVYDRVLPNSAFATLWVLAIGMALVLCFEFSFRVLRGAIIDGAGRRADVKLASRIFDHVMRIRLKEKPASSGAFANRLREFETVREFFSSASLLAIVDVLFISLFLIVIYQVGGPMVVIPAIAVVIVILAGLIIQPFMMKTVRSVQEEAALKHSLLIEAITGLETIKSLNAEGNLLKQWEGIVDTTARSTERMRFFSMNIINFTMVVQQTVSVAIVVYGVYLFDQGSVSMGAIIATVLLAARAVGPLGIVASTLARLQQSIVALKNLDMIMATGYENDDANLQVSRPITKGEIEFRDVSFTYPETQAPALQNLTFHIKPGDKVGIIGKVGAGKSTLAQLIASLYEPDSGSIMIDGMNISQVHTADVRDAMGIILQDVVLFRGTARENIAFGKPGASDEDVLRAAEISGAAEFINAHPMGFGMPVGERGQFLSGGQRQFLALARALLNDPAILLLDEPTCAMDNASEALFMNRLAAATKEKTVILSTHRQSLLNIVDKLMLMDNGRLIAFGPKQDVLNYIRNMVTQSAQQNQQKAQAAPNTTAKKTAKKSSAVKSAPVKAAK